MRRRAGMRPRAWMVALALGALACGDADPDADRGYTKAPLENPGLLVASEDASPMVALGGPDLLGSEDPAGADFARPRASAQEAGGGEAEQEVPLAPGVTQEQFDEGRRLFSGQAGCQACHGPNAGGSQLGPDLTDAEWLHISGPKVDELARVITTGVAQPQQYPAPMPAMGGASLSEQQVRSLAGYLASLSQR